MDELMAVRATVSADIAALQKVLNGTELFPSDMLPRMIAGFLAGTTDEIWLTCEAAGVPAGFCYAVPEQLADGAWNMLAIAVYPAVQGKGYGSAIVRRLETDLTALGQRIVIADTSGTEAFAQTRKFYAKNGYDAEATIRDFWAEGDDKVVFRKALR